MQANRQSSTPNMIAIGALLFIFGAAMLVAQLVNFEWPSTAWPFLVILPGVALLLLGLTSAREPGMGLTVAGSIVTTIGVMLLVMEATDLWASWAYAWALIPTAAGLGLVLAGLVHGDPEARQGGLTTMLVGGTLFALGLVFFEGIIGINGEPVAFLSGAVAPAILVVVGGLILARGLFFGGRGHEGGETR